MGDKYKVKKDDLRALFSTADMLMENRYHGLYEKFGWKKGSNGNYHCWNVGAHSKGADLHASLSVDNRTGLWHCFSCGIKGNFQSYWKEYLKGRHGDSYTDFIIDFLGLQNKINFSKELSDPDYEKNSKQICELFDRLQTERVKERGKPMMLSSSLTEIIKETTSLPMSELNEMVDRLLKDTEALNYLHETRRITPEVIKKYKLGLTDKGKFIFPQIGADGSLINLKAYDPRNPNTDFKWSYPHRGLGYGPMPINNFTHQKIYFFAGEPDCYCALAMGIDGAVTLGSEAMTDVDKIFGEDKAKQLFYGKETVVCLDADDSGMIASKKLADSLYKYVKQVKIINFNISEINPNGLDPNKMIKISKDGKEKMKRAEKDFTEFMVKNGFGKEAIDMFYALEKETIVYTQNTDRTSREIFKVTLQESRMPKYYSFDGSKVIRLVASVGDFDGRAILYPKEIGVKCGAMCNPDNVTTMCRYCKLPTLSGFNKASSQTLHIERELPKEFENDPTYIKATEHDILGLVEVTENQKLQQIKKLCQINDHCKSAIIQDLAHEKLLHVRLVKDINEFGDPTDSAGQTFTAIDMDAYMVEKDIYPNRSYEFEAVLTTSWNGQQSVLFCHKAEPIATCIDTFKMDQQNYEILQVFKPKPNETIKQHLKRRYDIFANACGVTERREMFFVEDLVFFSPLQINNKKLLPGITRGWVEALIIGDTRTCKTLITKWLRNHYKMGDMVTGSTAVTRSGLLGGIRTGLNRPMVSWGKIPMNDGGLIIIDELSNVDIKTLIDLTGCRSEGIASIDGIASGKVLARTRKIMLSNPRAMRSENEKNPPYGIIGVKDFCVKDEVLSRFDIVLIVRESDVPAASYVSSYEQINTEFNELQCQTLIRWIYSRKPDQYVFEEGFEEAIDKYMKKMLIKYHESTQLVNQEMRAKLMRMSMALAGGLASMPEDDWDKIYTKIEHLDYIVEFLDQIYCHPNMQMDHYSKMKRASEKLGDMAFMNNICKYIDINQLIYDDDFTEKHIQQMFYDYLERVQTKDLYIPDVNNVKLQSIGLKIYESTPKLINLLVSKNCFTRSKKGTYRKTKQFNIWLLKRLELGNEAPTSNILECVKNQQNSIIIEATERFGRPGRQNSI